MSELTRAYKETVSNRLRQDSEFASALLDEAVERVVVPFRCREAAVSAGSRGRGCTILAQELHPQVHLLLVQAVLHRDELGGVVDHLVVALGDQLEVASVDPALVVHHVEVGLDPRTLETDLRRGADTRRPGAKRDETEGAGGGVERGGAVRLLPPPTVRPTADIPLGPR